MEVRQITTDQRNLNGVHIKWALLMTVSFALTYYPVISRVVFHWWYDPDYGHGFLILPTSLFLAWQKRHRLASLPITQDAFGLPILISGLLLLLLGSLGRSDTLSFLSFPLVSFGLLLSLVGRKITAELIFPVAFLSFMFPIPSSLYNQVTLPLKLFTSYVSATIIEMFNVPVYREGNILIFANVSLEVATACSGIRSLMSLSALAAAVAYFTPASYTRKTCLFLAAIPIAIMANVLRTTVTAILANHYGAQMAEGFFHELSGFVVFFFSLTVLLILRAILIKGETS